MDSFAYALYESKPLCCYLNLVVDMEVVGRNSNSSICLKWRWQVSVNAALPCLGNYPSTLCLYIHALASWDGVGKPVFGWHARNFMPTWTSSIIIHKTLTQDHLDMLDRCF
ncbi:hypothetical protein GQ457_08G018910 [Hibiscus cannabinus]